MKDYRWHLIVFTLFAFASFSVSAKPVDISHFGLNIQHSNTAFPRVKFGSQRLWDSGTTWTLVEPNAPQLGKPRQYNWTKLDQHVQRARAKNIELLYTFGGVPNWAASDKLAVCAFGPGQCSPPKSWEDWKSYVRAIATRYTNQISAYELWNEPDYHGERKFWRGTPYQLKILCSLASDIIREVYSKVGVPVKIISPGFVDSNGVRSFLENGGGQYVDAIGFHGYPDPFADDPEGNLTIRVNAVKDAAEDFGMSEKELWDTEAGWTLNTQYPEPMKQAGFLAKMLLMHASLGMARFYWYAYDNPIWGTMLESAVGLNRAGRVYTRVVDWIEGSSFVEPCRKLDATLWQCILRRRDNSLVTVMWNRSGNRLVTIPLGSREVTTLWGIQCPVGTSRQINVGIHPVFISNRSTTTTCKYDGKAPFHSHTLALALNEGSGTQLRDAVTQRFLGTLGGALWSANGFYGIGVLFDGPTPQIRSSFLTPSFQRTVMMWAKTTGSPTNDFSRLFERIDSGRLIESLYWDQKTQTLQYMRGGSAQTGSWLTNSPNFSNWTHIAIAYHSNSTSTAPMIYINGVSAPMRQVTAPMGTLIVSGQPYYFGNRAVGDRGWPGLLDEIQIFDQVLSTTEIIAFRNSPIR